MAAGVCLAWALIRTFGLEDGYLLVGLVTFTPYAVPGAVLVLVASLLLRVWLAAGASALAGVLLMAVLAPRIFGGPEAVPRGEPEATIVAGLNLYRGAADPGAVVSLVRRAEIDVLCLSEISLASVQRLDDAGLSRLLPHRALQTGPGAAGTAVFSRVGLSARRGVHPGLAEQPMARAVIMTAPTAVLDVVSVHARAPTDGGAVNRWSEALASLPEAGQEGTQLLIGDFNATLDHAALRDVLGRGYQDAGEVLGSGLTGTWPELDSSVPPVTLDHLLVEASAAIAAYDVVDVQGTDHRAVIAEITVPE